MTQRFEIQHRTLAHGWVNTWTDTSGQPVTFATQEQAEAELRDYVQDEIAFWGRKQFAADDHRVVAV
jgi:hypothetical protein